MSNYSFQGAQPPPSLTAMTANSNFEFNVNQAWIMDTGSTHHMTIEMAYLSMLAQFEGEEKITVRNGECFPAKNIGSTSIHSNSQQFHLLDVLHVPNLAASFISVYTLCKENNCFVILDEYGS